MQTIPDIPPCPPRPGDAHKGTFGTVIIVGGCRTMLGAPALAASAALRSGAGLVKVCTLPEILPFVLSIEPGATGIEMSDVPTTLAAIDEADPQRDAVLAVGPGLGRSQLAQQLVLALLDGPRALVLDADGLNALAASGRRLPKGSPRVFTPHPGEFRRMAPPLGIAEDLPPPQAAAALAQAHHAVIVLKGAGSIVSDGQRYRINGEPNPALATAGSGDVLTGLIAALMAQHMSALDAANLGTHLHHLAAALWRDQHGPSGMTARDLAALLPQAFQQHRRC